MGYSPWGRHHDYGSSSSYVPSSSDYYSSAAVNHYTSWPPSSYPYPHSWPHTLHTAPSKSSWPSVASENRTVSSAPSRAPVPSPTSHPQHDLTTGALVAAIVVPILLLLSGIALVVFWLRKRPADSHEEVPPDGVVGGMKEKLGSFNSFRRRRDPPPPPPPPNSDEPPVVTSQQNNAYYTGLDTSSFGSRGDSGEYELRSSEEPPPPYVHEPSPPSVDARARSPFDDPPEAVSRSNSGQVAAMSLDAISTTTREGRRRVSDPFASPTDSPVSAMSTPRDVSPGVSDIHEADRR